LFPRLKIKPKGCHFDTIEVIEAESKVLLNTLIEHYLQDAFKQMAEVLETVHMVMVASRYKVIFYLTAEPVSEIMDTRGRVWGGGGGGGGK
jgi:hypothetical protein